ncbi:MAG: hypothetical protein IKO90_02250 [Bacteroidales bacterium]|nr:hypothetical protein [Bacteroidales bacterium]
MKHFFFNIALVFCLGCVFTSCQKDFYATSDGDRLSLSDDSVRFDTLFTQKGSITQCVKIINNCKGIIKINRIYLSKQKSSEFYFNVNGYQGPLVENIDIDAGDSVFVFVQTKLGTQNVDTILFHEDLLKIEYNSVCDSIILCAWGQDVINFKGEALNTTTFTAGKPYVIYDSLIVNKGETLTIEAGARLYFHYNANLFVRGTLKIQGTSDSPVNISSDRLEQTYQLLPGQWGSIVFEPSSSNNEISYTKIINGTNGLVFHGQSGNDIACEVANSQISNMSGYGIFAQNAAIECYNSILANCEYSIVNVQGGSFHSVHNTIYNEGTPQGRKYFSSVSISDYKTDSTTTLTKKAEFYNTIIAGSMSNEITITAENGDNSMPCLFQNCLLRDTYTKADSTYYIDNVFYDREKTLFTQPGVYTLDSLSQAINIGKLEFASSHPTDILTHSRTADDKPDAGAIEYYYEEKKD